MIVYEKNEKAIWTSNTAFKGTPKFHLDLNSDGTLVLYDATGAVLWKIGNSIFKLWEVGVKAGGLAVYRRGNRGG